MCNINAGDSGRIKHIYIDYTNKISYVIFTRVSFISKYHSSACN